MSKFQARKVTEPKAVVRNLPEGVPPTSGLGSAWGSREEAWSVMRRIDQRMSEAEKPTSYEIGLGARAEAALSMQRQPQYTDRMSTDAGVKIEDFAQTGQLKSKLASLSRKVSKKDDKYKEDADADRMRTRSPLRESSNNGGEKAQRHRSRYSQHKERERRDKFDLKPVQYNDTQRSNKPGVYWTDTQGSKVSGYYSTMTDSGLVEDMMDTRVLNDHVPSARVTAKYGDRAAAVTHVDVPIPRDITGPAYNENGVNDTYTVPSQSRSRAKLKLKSSGLKKIQEKIAQQKMNMSSSTDAGSASETSLLKDLGLATAHDDDEIVIPKQYELYTADHPPVITQRKVAAGPKAPTYKGFNEAEAKYRAPDGRVLSQSQHNRHLRQQKKDKLIAKQILEQDLDTQPVKDISRISHAGSRSTKQDEKPAKKEMKRVIAPRKPVTEEKPLDMITTRSWREGQKLLGERGLIKPAAKKASSSHEKETKKTRTKTPGGEDQHGVDVPDRHRGALSDTAKAVLDDLKSDHSDSERAESPAREKKRSPAPFRRKRPRPLEPVKEEKVVPQKPKYDRKEVLQYMRKQQETKKRQEKEKREEERMKEEKRVENLKKLADTQREAARRAKSAERRDAARMVTSGPPAKAPSSGSDKENTAMDASSDSTLTEMDTQPAARPKVRTSQDSVRSSQQKGAQMDDLIRQYLEQDRNKEQDRRVREQASQELLKKYLTGQPARSQPIGGQSVGLNARDAQALVRQATGLDPNEFVQKFGSQFKQLNPRFNTDIDLTDSLPARDVIPHMSSERPFVSNQGGAKWDRVQRIKQMSSDLQSRLQQQKEEMSSMKGASSADYVGRYQRMTGARQDVFTGQLPGVGVLSGVERRREETDAATRIQAAYRGHTVRQSMDRWLGAPQKADGDDSADLSASTVSDDSQIDYNKPPSKGLAAHLGKPAFCVDQDDKSTGSGLEIKYLKPSQTLYAWREPKGDPNSVMNIYERRRRELAEKAGVPYPVLSDDDITDAEDKDESEASITLSEPSERAASPSRAKSPVSPRSRNVTTRSLSYQDDFESLAEPTQSFQAPTQSHLAPSSSKHVAPKEQSVGRSLAPSSSRRGGDGGEVDSDDMDDTLEVTITNSQYRSQKKDRSKSSKKEPVVSDISPVSSFSEDSTAMEQEPAPSHKFQSTAPPSMTLPPPAPGQRMSPAMLQQRLGGALGFLESTEESLRQVTEVERVRAVSLAQQETVSLAQIVKAQKLGFDQDMARLQMKIRHEEQEAAKKLEETRRQTKDKQEERELDHATRDLLEKHEEAAQATLEAAKQLAETFKTNSFMPAYHQGAYSSRDSYTSASAHSQQEAARFRLQHMTKKPSDERATQYSARSYSQYTTEYSRATSYATDTYLSESDYTKSAVTAKKKPSPDGSQRSDSEIQTAEDLSLQKTESIKSDGVVTADDGSRRSSESIRTESGAAVDRPASPPSKSESIHEDYSQSFDTSMTEEDLERSMRDVLPSEGQRRRFRRNRSGQDLSNASFSDYEPAAGASNRAAGFERDTFSKFISEMYEKYLREPDLRQKHQELELKQREKAVSEKLDKEEAWYDQQKRKLRDKGTDEHYPQIKKQRGVIRKLRLEQAEIKKRLKEQQQRSPPKKQTQRSRSGTMVAMATSTPIRSLNYDPSSDSSDFDYYVVSTQSRDRQRRTSAAPSRSSLHVGGSPSRHDKDYKSDSEIYSESNGQPPSPSDNRIKQFLRNIDEKFLTKREQELNKRRKNAYDLLAWNQRLDQEEQEIAAIERQALEKWETKDRKKGDKRERKREGSSPSSVSKDTVVETAKGVTPRTPRTPRHADVTESVATDIVTESAMVTDRDALTDRDAIRSRSVRSITEEISALQSRKFGRTASESSIPEEEHLKKDSSDDTIINTSVEYGNDTFETTEPTGTASRRTGTASSQPAKQEGKVTTSSPKHARKPYESESEESVNIPMSETASEQSDVENRIRMLNEELQRRKREADQLKREHKRSKTGQLREKEETLRKQIKAYDSYIDQVRGELADTQQTTKPVIKQPAAAKTSSRADDNKRPEVDSTLTNKEKPTVSIITSGDLSSSNGEQRSPSPSIKGKLTPLDSLKDAKPESQSERLKPVANETKARPPLDRSERTTSITEDIEDIASVATDFDKSEVKFALDKSAKDEPSLHSAKPESKAAAVPDSIRSITEDLSYTEPVTEPSKPRTEPSIKTYSPDYESDHSSSYTYSRSRDRSPDSRSSYYSSEDYSTRSGTKRSERDREPSEKPKTPAPADSVDFGGLSERTDTKLGGVVTDKREMTMEIVSERRTIATDIPTEDIHTDEDISEALSVETFEPQEGSASSQEGVLKIDLKAPTIEELNKSQEFDKPEGTETAEVEAALPEVAKSQELSQDNVDIRKIEPPAMPLSQDDAQLPVSPRKDAAEDSIVEDISQSELMSAIISAAEAAEKFQEAAPKDETEELTDIPAPVVESEDEKEATSAERVQKEDKASEMATKSLLNEAIDTMLSIKKRKEVDSPVEQEKTETTPEVKNIDDLAEDVEIPMAKDDVTVTPLEDEIPPRPESPDIPDTIPTIHKTDLDNLYDELESAGPDDFWVDDEFGFQEPRGATKEELRLDLTKIGQPEVKEIVYHIDNKKPQVADVVDRTIDVYWEKRRYGESWEGVDAPSNLFTSADQGSELESRSRKTYKQLLFDLTGEILCDMYVQEEEVMDTPPWAKPPPIRHKYYKGKAPPTTSDSLKPLAQSHVMKYLHIDDGQSDSTSDLKSKQIGRKKKDHVDEILIQELREEEPDWVNYDADELAVKMQLADAIFDSLLVETGHIIAQIPMSQTAQAQH